MLAIEWSIISYDMSYLMSTPEVDCADECAEGEASSLSSQEGLNGERKFHDPQKFLYVWDMGHTTWKRRRLQPTKREEQEDHVDAYNQDFDCKNRLYRVAKYHRRFIREKLQLFSRGILLGRKIYKHWKKRIRQLDQDRLFIGDLFAWGVLPVRALQHPDQWVPLPAGIKLDSIIVWIDDRKNSVIDIYK